MVKMWLSWRSESITLIPRPGPVKGGALPFNTGLKSSLIISLGRKNLVSEPSRWIRLGWDEAKCRPAALRIPSSPTWHPS